ncbi:DHH family phosphoesterase [Psychromonas sp. PT13]|uniref:DHH family phosphoesterase n=1 Tax=Psychromonas sp. PT13 TaxID=3439547 RepID=UPI003EB70A6D
MIYDVFNGDADGIIALLQLRLAEPLDTTLITGVKRNIQLLAQIDVQPDDVITVLDVSMEKNMPALVSALEVGAEVFYADHHRSGAIPDNSNLQAHIDLDANTCTALIIDKLLDGQFHEWAITAAYGDNLIAKADQLSKDSGIAEDKAALLKELGTLINYNGYGAKIDDLHYDPAELYKALMQYSSPFQAIADQNSPYYVLQKAHQQDMDNALSVEAKHLTNKLGLFELPNAPWARRISGVYGNLLANQAPDSAHAVLTLNKDATYMVSLRAPLNNKQGAGDICSQFETGGGRAAAAGINALPAADLQRFIDLVEGTY